MGNNSTRILREAFNKKTCKWCTYYIPIGHMCQKTGNCTEMEEVEYGTVCKFIDVDEDLKKEYPIKE